MHMSRRFTLIPIAFIVIVGAVWAGSLMIPDTPTFPSLPSTPGTLWDVLKNKFRWDGTALNWQKLGGSWSESYLKWTNCTASDAVWKWIDASGNPICKWPPLAFAEIYEWTMQVNGAPQTVGYLLREWDKIETNTTQTGTIRFTHNPSSSTFTPGDSIARLGTGTTVLVDRGDTAGTLALITLQDGLLWWRVLTSTGINFGGGGVIAGVRGTSIALEKVTGQPIMRMVIPHSQRTGNNLTNAAARIRTIYNTGALSPLQFRRSVEFNSGTVTNIVTLSSTNRTLQALYTTWQPARLSPWIARNTVQDLTYMIWLNRPGWSYVSNEIAATEPVKWSLDDPCKVNNTLWYDRTTKCVSAYADASTNYDLVWNNSRWEALAVKDLTWSTDWGNFRDGNNIGNFYESGNPFSPTLYRYMNLYEWALWANADNINNWYNQRCNWEDNTYANRYCSLLLANYETSPRTTQWNLYKWVWVLKKAANNYSQNIDNWGASWWYDMIRFISGYRLIGLTRETSINTGTLDINERWRYLTYAGNLAQLERYLTGGTLAPGFSYSQLAGKTITIELVNAPVINANSKYLLDLWWVSYYMVNNELRRRIGATPPTTERSISTSDRIFELTIPTGITIDRFIIGNSQTLSFNAPINNIVQKIIIK